MEICVQCIAVGSFIAYLILQLIRWIRADSDLTVQWAEWWGKKPGKSPAEFLVSCLSPSRPTFPLLLLGVGRFLPHSSRAGTWQFRQGCARPPSITAVSKRGEKEAGEGGGSPFEGRAKASGLTRPPPRAEEVE